MCPYIPPEYPVHSIEKIKVFNLASGVVDVMIDVDVKRRSNDGDWTTYYEVQDYSYSVLNNPVDYNPVELDNRIKTWVEAQDWKEEIEGVRIYE